MKKKDIEDFIDRQEKIYERNYRNYQETGITRYERTYHKAEDLIDLARQALNAADDHDKMLHYDFLISKWGSRAISLVNTAYDQEKILQLIKEIAKAAEAEGVNNPWK